MRSFINKLKRSGPSIEPCGTPVEPCGTLCEMEDITFGECLLITSILSSIGKIIPL